jgi:hypothetical protein
MPSDRRQINIRLDPETEQRLPRVRKATSEALGLNLSNADVVRLALIELERKYPSPQWVIPAGELVTPKRGRPPKKGQDIPTAAPQRRTGRKMPAKPKRPVKGDQK